MKKLIAISILFCLFTDFTQAQHNVLTKKEQKEGWILLFDGQTSKGWKHYRGSPFPEKGWVIKDGMLTIDTSEGRPGDIVTEELFTDFEFSVDFRITKGANSGIKYFLLPNSNLGCEYQIYDDEKIPVEKRFGSKVAQGALFDVLGPTVATKNKPVGEWNNARIVAKGNRVEHWLNGKKVLTFDRSSDAFKAAKAESKFKDNKDWATPVQSPILLQEHGNEVSFRNIKIKRL